MLLGAGASIASRIVSVVMALVLMPVLFASLGRDELGAWFLCVQGTAFLGLLDLGLHPTVTREIALATGQGSEDTARLSRLVPVARRAFMLLACGIVLVGIAVGAALLPTLELGSASSSDVLTVWILLCASHAMTVWGGSWSALLHGRGRIGVDILVTMAVGAATTGCQIAAASLGWGILTLAVIACAGSVVARTITWGIAASADRELARLPTAWDAILAMQLAKPAWRAWVTALGAFAILKTDQFFIAAFRSTAEIPAYHAAYQVVSNVYAVAGALAAASAAHISQAWSSGDAQGAARILRRNLSWAVLVMGCGVGWILATGESLFTLWLGPGTFIGYPILCTFCVMLSLEAHHKTFEYAVRATGEEVFAGWYVASGVLNLVLTWLLIERFGLLGVAIATMIAQLTTLNWFAVRVGMRRFAHGARAHLPIAACGVGALVATFAGATVASGSLGASGDGGRLLLSTAVAAAIFASGLALNRRMDRGREVRDA